MEGAGPSSALHTAEIVHWIALGVMAIVYTTRILWLLSFKKAKDKSPPGGDGSVTPRQAAYHSLANVVMPGAMESTRKNMTFYLSFVLFHLGVVCGIALAFLSTLVPGFVSHPMVSWVFGVSLAMAFLIGVARLLRRIFSPVLRLISTPDDYFSLIMLTCWFGLGAITQGHLAGVPWLHNELFLVFYLYLTSFFLLYVPFSKISHYLYYPFTRWWLGKALGHRGSMPLNRG